MAGAYWESVLCVPEMTGNHCHLRQVRGRIGLFDEPRVLIYGFRRSVLYVISPQVRQRALPLKKKMFGYSSLRRNGTGRLSIALPSWSEGKEYDTIRLPPSYSRRSSVYPFFSCAEITFNDVTFCSWLLLSPVPLSFIFGYFCFMCSYCMFHLKWSRWYGIWRVEEEDKPVLTSTRTGFCIWKVYCASFYAFAFALCWQFLAVWCGK